MLASPVPRPARLRTRRGRPISISRAGPGDAEALAAMLGALSPETVARRYLTPGAMHPERARAEAERLARPDAGRIVLVARAGGEAAPIVAVGELARAGAEPAVAEGAIVVADAYQREGIGRAVAGHMADAARDAAVSAVRATVLAENTPVRRLIASLGRPYTLRHWRGELLVEIAV
ncbi:MAG TPA: GNAT family N-acetyltransferase [Chloroflexaceae bacterium]|nr:GNAT family N-acetyltransferase [Chloroflexaceae bacterium]